MEEGKIIMKKDKQDNGIDNTPVRVKILMSVTPPPSIWKDGVMRVLRKINKDGTHCIVEIPKWLADRYTTKCAIEWDTNNNPLKWMSVAEVTTEPVTVKSELV